MSHTVLVIEDNDQNLYLVTYILEKKGYAVIPARTGLEGIALADERRPDIILLDIQLPEMDGFGVAARLRENSDLDAIPIIAVTSHAMVGDREKILAAGCDGYLEKPVDPRTFARDVAEILEAGR